MEKDMNNYFNEAEMVTPPISEAEMVTPPISEAEKITPPLSEADKNNETVHLTDIFESEEQEVEQTAHKIR